MNSERAELAFSAIMDLVGDVRRDMGNGFHSVNEKISALNREIGENKKSTDLLAAGIGNRLDTAEGSLARHCDSNKIEIGRIWDSITGQKVRNGEESGRKSANRWWVYMIFGIGGLILVIITIAQIQVGQ
jgi:hypothetical protein